MSAELFEWVEQRIEKAKEKHDEYYQKRMEPTESDYKIQIAHQKGQVDALEELLEEFRDKTEEENND